MDRLKARWETPADRLTILIAIVVVLFAAAVIVAIVRYGDSRERRQPGARREPDPVLRPAGPHRHHRRGRHRRRLRRRRRPRRPGRPGRGQAQPRPGAALAEGKPGPRRRRGGDRPTRSPPASAASTRSSATSWSRSPAPPNFDEGVIPYNDQVEQAGEADRRLQPGQRQAGRGSGVERQLDRLERPHGGDRSRRCWRPPSRSRSRSMRAA